MTVKRIVMNVASQTVPETQKFYADLFDLTPVMDQGWIVTLASGQTGPANINIASQGGSGAPLPALSIEVDDVDATYARAQKLGHEIVYPITDEPWGLRRFFVLDPEGNIVNVASHE